MRDPKLISDFRENARKHLVLLAKSMLDGELPFFEGAPQVLVLKERIGAITDEDPDFGVFKVIASETDHLPLKRQQSLWSAEALSRLEPEFVHTEQWASSIAVCACRNLIERFEAY